MAADKNLANYVRLYVMCFSNDINFAIRAVLLWIILPLLVSGCHKHRTSQGNSNSIFCKTWTQSSRSDRVYSPPMHHFLESVSLVSSILGNFGQFWAILGNLGQLLALFFRYAWVGTKPRHFFHRGLIWRGIARGEGEWREFPGSKIEIFPRHVTPGRIFWKKSSPIFPDKKTFSYVDWRGNPG